MVKVCDEQLHLYKIIYIYEVDLDIIHLHHFNITTSCCTQEDEVAIKVDQCRRKQYSLPLNY